MSGSFTSLLEPVRARSAGFARLVGVVRAPLERLRDRRRMSIARATVTVVSRVCAPDAVAGGDLDDVSMILRARHRLDAIDSDYRPSPEEVAALAGVTPKRVRRVLELRRVAEPLPELRRRGRCTRSADADTWTIIAQAVASERPQLFDATRFLECVQRAMSAAPTDETTPIAG